MRMPQILNQKIMWRVVYALIPVALLGVYFFGWRVAAICATSLVCAFTTEWIMASSRKGKISTACFVTAGIYALSLPPTTPLWITGVGAVIAILFAKEAFGGFGKNVFNPAIVGRAFIYVCFPVELTARFTPVVTGIPGGFARWSFASAGQPPDYLMQAGLRSADAISAATPLMAHRDMHHTTDLLSLFLGNIGEVFSFDGFTKSLAAGSIGEVSTLLLIVCGIYLIATKTAQWRLTAATLAGAMALGTVLWLFHGPQAPPDPLFTLCAGGLMFAAVFMITDPVSAPKLSVSQWVYGAFVGMMIVFFRTKGVFVEGVGFALLLGNTIAPSLDLWFTSVKARKPSAAPVS